jgi:hypothetical protein
MYLDMIQSPANFFFTTKANCCNEHYDWSYSDCMGSSSGATGTGSGRSGDKWYADWTSGDYTCKNDRRAPDYSESIVASMVYLSFVSYVSMKALSRLICSG